MIHSSQTKKILSKELVLDARIIRLTNMEFYKELYLLKKTDCNQSTGSSLSINRQVYGTFPSYDLNDFGKKLRTSKINLGHVLRCSSTAT